MYDFYANPPSNKTQIRDWLTSWLEKPDSTPIFEVNGERFALEAGFRRAFHQHAIFRNVDTNEFVWRVVRDEDATNFSSFPKTRYSNYDTLLENVINDYYVQWKLTD